MISSCASASPTPRLRYDTPPTGVIQTLRLTPRNHDGQYVVRLAHRVTADCRLDRTKMPSAIIIHTFTAEGPFDELTVARRGRGRDADTDGVVSGTLERFPPAFPARDPLTTPTGDRRLRSAANARASQRHAELLHGCSTLHREMKFDTDPTHSATTATEAFALQRGVCQDLTHIFIASARHLDIPARYIGGYFCRSDGVIEQEPAMPGPRPIVPNLGWVGFDPANGICATDAHVRIASGSTISAPRRCAAPATAAATRRMKVTVRRHAGAAQSQTSSRDGGMDARPAASPL